jgi:hypothetical protein
MATDPSVARSNGKGHLMWLWLFFWRAGLLFLGLVGLLVSITGAYYFGVSLFGEGAPKTQEMWFFPLVAGFGLLFVAIAIKGWRIRAREDILEAQAAFEGRLRKLESWINK